MATRERQGMTLRGKRYRAQSKMVIYGLCFASVPWVIVHVWSIFPRQPCSPTPAAAGHGAGVVNLPKAVLFTVITTAAVAPALRLALNVKPLSSRRCCRARFGTAAQSH